MRKLLLLIVFISGNLMFGQVGIGTDLPNQSTQLEIVSSNRGILIPQVPLTDLTDRTTITAGNIPSLMVYNTSSNATMEPGYYYWFQDRWRRMISDTDVAGFSDVLVDNGDGTFTHTAVDGTVLIFDANTTTYVNNGDGTYTFTNANGATMTIDIIGDVINSIINEGDIYNEIINIILQNTDELVDNGDGTFTHTAVDGTVLVFDANTTSYVNNGDGTYTFTNANGASMVIDVIGDVVNNIINEGDIYDEIINIILQNSDELVDNGDGTFTHTAVDGTVLVFDANTTTFVNNGDGTYTFTNDNGESMLVDVIGDVVNNIQNEGDIYQEIVGIILENSDELVDNGDGTFTHTAVDGTVLVFDANTTSYVNNGDGSYTFTNANGDSLIIDIIADVVTNIQNQGDIYDEIINIILQNSDELVDNGDGTFTHTAVDGTVLVFDANTTSYVNNGDGSYTFTNANGDSMTIDIIADVVTNIQNQGDIYDEIINIILQNSDELVDNGDGTFTHTAVDGPVLVFDDNTTSYVNNGDGSYTFTNANGDSMTIDIIADVVTNIQNQGDIYDEIINIVLQNSDELVDNGDGTFTHTAVDGTVLVFDANTTSYVNNGDGSYTFTNANGDSMTIDIIADVVTNIQNQGDIYDEIINIILQNSDELVDNGDGTFTHTAVDGTVLLFDANTTSYVNNGDGTYTFTNANGATMTIDVIGDVVNNIINEGDNYDEIINIILQNSDELVDNGDGTFTHTAVDGTVLIFDANTTTFVDNGDGTYTFTNDNGESMLVDVIGDVVTNIQNQGDIYDEIINIVLQNSDELVDNGDGTFTHTAVDGTVLIFDANTTSYANNGDGTYTFTNANGDSMTIDVIGDVVTNIQNQGDIYDEILILIDLHETLTDLTYDASENTLTYTDEEGDAHTIQLNNTNLIYDETNQKLVYTNSKGETQEIDLGTLVAGNETVTTLIDNNDGTYTYTSEDGTVTVIDIPSSIVNNFEEIVKSGPVTVDGNTFTTIEEYIEYIANASVNIDGGDMITVAGTGTVADPYVVSIEAGAPDSMLITNAAGDLEWATIADIVAANETITTLVDHGDGTFTYTNEAGIDVTFDATRTNITDNGDGTYTLIDADGNPVIIDIPGDIINNFESIVHGGQVTVDGNTYNNIEEYIEYLVTATETLTELTYDVTENQLSYVDEDGNTHVIQLNNTNLSYDSTDQKLVYTNSKGETQEIDLGTLVAGNETVTTLIDNNDGTYTYTSENGTVTVIDIPASILNNFEEIVKSGPVTVDGNTFTTIEEYIEYIANTSIMINGGDMITVTGDGTATDPYVVSIEAGAPDSMLITNAAGDLEWTTIESIVQGNETITTLVDNNDGTYTYTSEDGTITVIDIPASILNNFEEIVKSGPVTVDGNTFTTIEEYIEYIANTSITINGGDMITVTGDGTATDPYVVSIEAGAPDSMLITNAAGDLEWATIESIVQGNETITTLVDNNDGTYTYTSEDGTITVIDIPASILNNFEEIVKSGPVTVDGNTFTTIEEYIEYIANTSITINGGDMITVTGDGTATDPYVVSIEAGAPDSMLITNAAGDLEWATIESIVQGNETITTLVDNNDGTYTYTSEDGTITVIDIPASILNNFEEIVKSGPVTVDGNTFTTIEEYIEYISNTSITINGGDMITVTGDGTATDPYV